MDNRDDTTLSMRTPLSRVKGLGASGGGTEHFWLQRLTAIANIPLAVAFVIVIANLRGADYAAALGIVSHPVTAILLLLFIVSALVHMRIGMQVIVEDYVHGKLSKIAALIGNTFFAILVGAASLFAVLKIALGSS